MASEFSSNIRQVAAELKETNAKTAAGVRRAIRKSVAIAAIATNEAIVAAAKAQELNDAASATNVKVSFSLTSGGAVIRTDQNKARYARPLEVGSQGSGGVYDRHPVFAGNGNGPLREGQSWFVEKIGPLKQGQHRVNQNRVYVNQPTRPYFFGTAQAMEPFSEAALNAALDVALQEAGWVGVERGAAAARASARSRSVQAARRKASTVRRKTKEAEARLRESHRVFGTKEQKAAVRKYDAAQAAKQAARRKSHP